MEKSSTGITPLHLAIRHGRKKIVELLLAKGAMVNAKDNDGKTPHMYALMGWQKEIAKLLEPYETKQN